jgi:hypothetical protein
MICPDGVVGRIENITVDLKSPASKLPFCVNHNVVCGSIEKYRVLLFSLLQIGTLIALLN